MFTTQLCIMTSEVLPAKLIKGILKIYIIWQTFGQVLIIGNLAPGKFGTADILALRIIWHHGQLGTIQFATANNLAQ